MTVKISYCLIERSNGVEIVSLVANRLAVGIDLYLTSFESKISDRDGNTERTMFESTCQVKLETLVEAMSGPRRSTVGHGSA